MIYNFLIRIQLRDATPVDYQKLYKRLAAAGFSASINIGPAQYRGAYPDLYAKINSTPFDGHWQLPNAEYFYSGDNLTGERVLEITQNVVKQALLEELSSINEALQAADEDPMILITLLTHVAHSGLKLIPANEEPLV